MPSSPRLSHAIAVEARVPALGVWFAAIVATFRADAVFLSTFHDVPIGTRVEVELAIPGGPPVVVAGVVDDDPIDGVGIEIAYADLDSAARDRLEAMRPQVPSAPPSGVRARVA